MAPMPEGRPCHMADPGAPRLLVLIKVPPVSGWAAASRRLWLGIFNYERSFDYFEKV